jgi:polysaccharide export outer membrane protein
MPLMNHARPLRLLWSILSLWVLCAGCHGLHSQAPPADVPHESAKVTHPPYVIEAPDVLLIDAVRLIPRPPYRIEPLDTLAIQVTRPGTKAPLLPNEPIAGVYTVTPEGSVDLGFSYRSVPLAGLTLLEARKVIENHLKVNLELKPPFEITVELVQSKAMQLIRGEHLVRADGTVGLGTYGSVYVDGMTLAEAKLAIEAHLSQHLLNPEISLDVSGFNSKVYYVIADLAGSGQQVYRLPITGKETVLDAIALIYGLPPVASKSRIWLARPAPQCDRGELTLPVDWNGITRCGQTATNYQIFPGDRLYVDGAPLVRTDTYLARVILPLERILGIALLAKTVDRQYETPIILGGGVGAVGGVGR